MAFTPDPVLIPYVSQAEIANAADVPDLSEDMALRLHSLISTLQTAVTTAQQNLVPVGLIAPFGGSVAPVGWALCNGQPHYSDALTAMLPSGANAPNMINRYVVAAISGTDSSGRANIYTRGNAYGNATDGNRTLSTTELPVHAHGFGWESPNNVVSNADTNHRHYGWSDSAGSHTHGNVYESRMGLWADTGSSDPNHFFLAFLNDTYQTLTADGGHGHGITIDWQSSANGQIGYDVGGDRYQHRHAGQIWNSGAGAAFDIRPASIAMSYIIKKGPGTVNGVYYAS